MISVLPRTRPSLTCVTGMALARGKGQVAVPGAPPVLWRGPQPHAPRSKWFPVFEGPHGVGQIGIIRHAAEMRGTDPNSSDAPPAMPGRRIDRRERPAARQSLQKPAMSVRTSRMSSLAFGRGADDAGGQEVSHRPVLSGSQFEGLREQFRAFRWLLRMVLALRRALPTCSASRGEVPARAVERDSSRRMTEPPLRCVLPSITCLRPRSELLVGGQPRFKTRLLYFEAQEACGRCRPLASLAVLDDVGVGGQAGDFAKPGDDNAVNFDQE